MSTFGKKALISWNYYNSKENVMRFNHTNLDMQLKILNKWYPNNTIVRLHSKNDPNWYNEYTKTFTYKIIDYEIMNDMINSYYLVLEVLDLHNQYLIGKGKISHPLLTIPTNEFLRDIKLNEIIN